MPSAVINPRVLNHTLGVVCLSLLIYALVGRFIIHDQMIYGSIISWHLFQLDAAFVSQLSSNIYPFYSFTYSLGLDSLAESQQGLAHPVKLLLAFIFRDPLRLSTQFLAFHVALFAVTSYYFLYKYLVRSYSSFPATLASLFATFSFLISIPVYSNLVHQTFVSALAYVPLIIAMIHAYFLTGRGRYLFVLMLSVCLMFLVGNFAMQWLSLVFAITFICVLTFVSRSSIWRLFSSIISLILGVLLAGPQIVSTLDLMTTTARGLPGGIDKFFQSTSPLQWLGYFDPGVIYIAFKYATSSFQLWTSPNVVEGVHYVGVIPVTVFIYALVNKSHKDILSRSLTVAGIWLCFRALGIFLIWNLALNLLPIFGQFRVPVRSLFLFDIAIVSVAAIALAAQLDRQTLRRLFHLVLTIQCVTVAYGVATIVLTYHVNRPPIWDLVGDVFLSLIPVAVTLSMITLLAPRYQHRLSHAMLLLVILALSIADNGLHLLGSPTHWTSPRVETIQQRAAEIDRLCESLAVDRIWIVTAWPQWNLPSFPLSKSESRAYISGHLYNENRELFNGLSCTVTYVMAAATLTPSSVVAVDRWWRDDVFERKTSALAGAYGFKYYAILRDDIERQGAITIDDLVVLRSDEDMAFVSDYVQESRVETTVGTGNSITAANNEWRFHSLTPTVYDWAVKLGISDRLPSRIFQVVRSAEGAGYVAVGSMPYIVLQDSAGRKLAGGLVHPFVQVLDENQMEARITFVPLPAVVGLFVTSFAILAAVLLLLANKRFGSLGQSGIIGVPAVVGSWAARVTTLRRAPWAVGISDALARVELKEYSAVLIIMATIIGALIWAVADNAGKDGFRALLAWLPFPMVVWCVGYLVGRLRNMAVAVVVSVFLTVNFGVGITYWILVHYGPSILRTITR